MVRIVVFGAGAIGSLFGARLAAAGHDVRLVGRGAHLVAIQQHGLKIIGAWHTDVQLPASDRLEESSRADQILLTVKTFDLGAAGRSIAQAYPNPVPVLALQNGLGIKRSVERSVREGGWQDPDAWIQQGINSLPATLVEPGIVRQAGDGEILLNAGDSGDAKSLEGLLLSGQIACRRVKEFDREVWRKAVINAAINPLTADHRIANGYLARDPWRRQALDLLHEAGAVARAEGYEFTEEELEADLFRVVRSTAENHSSMLQDIERGRPTEIEAISGEILRLGEQHHVQLPATERVVARIRQLVAMESHSRPS